MALQTFSFANTGIGNVGTIQQFIVPATGTYRITAIGARGGKQSEYNVGGKGARMIGEFELTKGQELLILVGQAGQDAPGDQDAGGGGGTFVVKVDPNSADIMTAPAEHAGKRVTPLIIAGGGGGDSADRAGVDASVSTTSSGSYPNSEQGTGGQGGHGSGGGGFRTNGISRYGGQGGFAFLNGGSGGKGTTGAASMGGFGGGAGGSDEYGAGGGGYTGGNGTDSGSPGSGGGGSFNSGSNQVNTPGVGTGHGSVLIETLALKNSYSDGIYTKGPIPLSVQRVSGSVVSWVETVTSGVNSAEVYVAITSQHEEPDAESYTQVFNGDAVPGIEIDEDLTGKFLFIKVVLHTDDPTDTPIVSNLSVNILEYMENTKVVLTIEPTNTFRNVEGDLTVVYDQSKGSLRGKGGPVQTFTQTFTPVELIQLPNPNDREVLTVKPSIQLAFPFISYKDVFSNSRDVICALAPRATAVLTNVSIVNP